MDTMLLVVLLLGTLVSAATGAEWSYKDIGAWPGHCNNPSSKRQSPVNIEKSKTSFKQLGPIALNGFDAAKNFILTNDGHSVVAKALGEDIGMSGGGLPGTYRVAQFHFHWGAANSRGSEHQIDGRAAPMELHIVTFNLKYGTIGQALQHGDGLAVLGVNIEVGESDHPTFEHISGNLRHIPKKDASVQLQPLKLGDFLPSDRTSFFRYLGGLTTPSCDESVVWTVLHTPTKISQKQLDVFRLKGFGGSGDHVIVDNFRPVQPLHSRVVETTVAFSSAPCAKPLFAVFALMIAAVLIMFT